MSLSALLVFRLSGVQVYAAQRQAIAQREERAAIEAEEAEQRVSPVICSA